MKISKYEFNDEASALSKIASLPHATDEDGNVTIDHPYGWKSKAIDLDDEGVHGFFGVKYQDNKM